MWGARVLLCSTEPILEVLGPRHQIDYRDDKDPEHVGGVLRESRAMFDVIPNTWPPYKKPAFLIPSPSHSVIVDLATVEDEQSAIRELCVVVFDYTQHDHISAVHLETDYGYLAMFWDGRRFVINSNEAGPYREERGAVVYELMHLFEGDEIEYEVEDLGDLLNWPPSSQWEKIPVQPKQ